MAELKNNIVFIGEAMIQLQADANGLLETTFAGDTLNTATYLSRLGAVHGAQVDYMTALGNDAFSDSMIASFQKDGVNCDQIRRIENKHPGLYHVNLDDNGERSFMYWRGESAAKELFKENTRPAVESLTQYGFIYVSGISLAILDSDSRERLLELLTSAKAQGSRICFDNNFRPKLWRDVEEAQHWYMQLLALTDYAFLTFDDELLLWGNHSLDQLVSRYQDLNIQQLVIKRGSEPCVIVQGRQLDEVPAVKLDSDQVIDTNAAGDSFSAGYLCGLLCQADAPTLCARVGHLVASTVIQYRGAVIERGPIRALTPTIERFLSSD